MVDTMFPDLPQFSSPRVSGAVGTEGEMLLICARLTVTPCDAGRLRNLSARRIDWTLLFKLARKHRSLPLIVRNLELICPGVIPGKWVDRLSLELDRNAQRNLELAAETSLILSLAECAGISALTFKGPALAAATYDDLKLRQVWDIDLLVESHNFFSFARILESHGYFAQKQFDCARDFLHATSGMRIDLHWGLTSPFFPVHLDICEILSRRRSILVGGVSCAVPSDDDMLFILCLQVAKDCWERRQHLEYLSKAVDIADFLRSTSTINWNQAVSHARQHGCLRVLHFGLGLASVLLDAPLPASMHSEIAHDPIALYLVGCVCRRLFSAEDLAGFKLADAPFTIRHRYRQLRFYMAMRERPADWLSHFAAIVQRGVPRLAGAWLDSSVKSRALAAAQSDRHWADAA